MKKIIITGSNGFIGKHVSDYFKKKKYRTLELSSSKKNIKNWKLGQSLPVKKLDNTIILHFAFDLKSLKKGLNLKRNNNYKYTVELSDQIEKYKDSKFFFISSQTANKKAKSLYGKIKFLIENKIILNKNTKIIIPGFVYHKNDSKIVIALKKILRFKFFPIIDYKNNLNPIHINDFCEALEKIILDKKNRKYYLGSIKPINFKRFIKHVCRDNNIQEPYFIYIPLFILNFIAAVIDKLNILEISIVERINSLAQLKKINTIATFKSLKIKPKYKF